MRVNNALDYPKNLAVAVFHFKVAEGNVLDLDYDFEDALSAVEQLPESWLTSDLNYKAINLRFKEKLTQKETAARLETNVARVRRAEDRCIKHLAGIAASFCRERTQREIKIVVPVKLYVTRKAYKDLKLLSNGEDLLYRDFPEEMINVLERDIFRYSFFKREGSDSFIPSWCFDDDEKKGE